MFDSLNPDGTSSYSPSAKTYPMITPPTLKCLPGVGEVATATTAPRTMNTINGNNNAGAVVVTNGVIVDEYWVQDGRVVATRAHTVDEPEENMQRDIKLPWKLTIWAWVLLAIEVVVMGALYMDGGGRVALFVPKDGTDPSTSSFDKDDYECFIGEGTPILAQSVVLRDVTAVCTQLIVFCISDRGLLKPFEAMWVLFASLMRCWGVPEFNWTETYLVRYSDGTERVERSFTAPCWILFFIIRVILPVFFIMIFTGNVAMFGIAADCELGPDGTFWFRTGYLIFLVVCFPLLSCVSERKAKPIAQYARAFVVIDSITIGSALVFGNYVQSGIVAVVFGFLPAFNLYLAYRECRLMFQDPPGGPASTSPIVTESEA